MGFDARFDTWRLPGLSKWFEYHRRDLSHLLRVALLGALEAQSTSMHFQWSLLRWVILDYISLNTHTSFLVVYWEDPLP